jgi:putative lipoprotein
MNVAIFGGCNRFVGSVTVTGGQIAFPDNFAGTLMACPPDVEELERGFLAALRGVVGYVRYGTGLVLTDGEGRALLHLVERPE